MNIGLQNGGQWCFCHSLAFMASVSPKVNFCVVPICTGSFTFCLMEYGKVFFITTAALQCVALYRDSLCLRAISAFMTTTLLIWGDLNVLVYGARWYFALIAWGVFATINFCALSRILTDIERKARGKVF